MDEPAERSEAEPRSNWLSAVADVPLARPKLAVLVALIIMVCAGVVAYDLPVSTSRYELVSEKHPFQARLFRFFDKFGYPDSLVFVVSGDDEEARRAAVDQLSKNLEADPELEGRVLGRVGLEQIAEVVLLIKPEALQQFSKELGSKEFAPVVEGGLPMWLGTVDEQLEAGMDSDEPVAGDADPDEAVRNLAKLVQALDARLQGDDALRDLPKLNDGDAPRGFGVDAKGYIVSADRKYHLVALFPDIDNPEGQAVEPLVTRVRKIRDETKLGGVTAELTGLPALVSDELVAVKRGLQQTSLATTLGILLLLYAAFRSFRYTILALLPLGVGLLITLGVVRLTYGGLNLITSSFIPVLLALGIDFGVYVLSRYGELSRGGASPNNAIRGALARAGPGMVIGAITTMMAFMMTTTTEFTAYSQLGVIAAVGLALMLLVTFLLLPALLSLAGRGRTIKSPELPGVSKLPALVRAGRLPILILAVIGVGYSATQWSKLEFNARYFDFLPEQTESARGLREIERDESVSPVLAGVPTDSVPEARAMAEKLRTVPSVGAVQSATDVLPKLDETRLGKLRAALDSAGRTPDFDKLRNRTRNMAELRTTSESFAERCEELAFELRRAGRDTKAADELSKAASALAATTKALGDDVTMLASLEVEVANLLQRAWTTANSVAKRGHYTPEDLPPIFRARFVSKDGKSLAVYATPKGDIWNKDVAKQFSEEVTAAAPEASGMAINIHEHIRMIREGCTRASLLSAALVLVVLLAGFRRVLDTLLALLPAAIGFACLLGIMATIDLDFDVANVVVLPLILGIGIDAGAHMTHRWRQSVDASADGVAQLDDIIRGTGAAVLLASLTTALGFSALCLGEYGAMKTLGLSMSLGVGCCLLASVLVLPALLVLCKKAR